VTNPTPAATTSRPEERYLDKRRFIEAVVRQVFSENGEENVSEIDGHDQ
jgi:hypothetical protein